MRTSQLLAAILVLLTLARIGYGTSTETIGPYKDHYSPIVEQPGWPAGMIPIPRHDSRVYLRWTNGSEIFYFKAAPEQIGDLIKLYSEARLRDRVVLIKKEKAEVKTSNGDKGDYNVEFCILGEMALAMMTRQDAETETNEPKLTIFDDSAPAADFEDGVSTKVTLREENVKAGIQRGKNEPQGTQEVRRGLSFDPPRPLRFINIKFREARAENRDREERVAGPRSFNFLDRAHNMEYISEANNQQWQRGECVSPRRLYRAGRARTAMAENSPDPFFARFSPRC